jgi:hypothetical protein
MNERLTDEEIEACRDAGDRAYMRHRWSIRGQQITPQDSPDWHFARAIEAAILARAAVPIVQPWQPIETAPKDGRALLLGHFNSHGKWRTVRGQWFSADEIAETFENPDGCDEGWFETVVESDDIPNCWATEPTHWMPLPLPPKEAL